MILIIVLIGVALLLALFASWLMRDKNVAPIDNDVVPPSSCCGAHEVCDKDSLLSASDTVDYYNDEELDRYQGRGMADYSDNEIDEFRDVLLTLLPHDVAGWLKSIQLRGIQLPSIVRDEALMVVGERRTVK